MDIRTISSTRLILGSPTASLCSFFKIWVRGSRTSARTVDLFSPGSFRHEGWRSETSITTGRWTLSLFARSSNGAGAGKAGKDGVARSEVADARRHDPAFYRPSDKSLHYDRGGPGKMEIGRKQMAINLPTLR